MSRHLLPKESDTISVEVAAMMKKHKRISKQNHALGRDKRKAKAPLALTLLLTLIFTLVFLPNAGIQPAQAAPTFFQTLYPEEDTYINEIAPAKNYGLGAELEVGYYRVEDYAGSYYSLIHFNLAELPPDATIEHAYLKLYLKEGTGGIVRVERITSPWDELSATWHNQPSIWTYDGLFVPALEDVGPSLGTYTWEVTSWVQSWFAGEYPNYGFVVMPQSTSPESRSVFHSKEYWGELYDIRRPRLEVSYESGTPPEPPEPPPEPPTDTAPPEVDITIDPPANISPADTVTISATATDDAGLGSLELTINGVRELWGASEAGVLQHTVSYTGSFGYGTYAVWAHAWDRAGKDGAASTEFQVMGGGQPPVVTISCSPSEVFPNDNATLAVTVTASDPEGIREITVGVGNGFGSPSSYPDYGDEYTIDPPYPTSFTHTFTFPNLDIPNPTGDPLIGPLDATKIVAQAQAQDAEYLFSDIETFEITVVRPYQWDYGLQYPNPSRDQLPWEVMDDVFGSDETHNCGPRGETCWRTSRAKSVYRDIKDLARPGECVGMSAYSVIHFNPFGTDEGIPIPDTYTHIGRDHFLRPESYVVMTAGWGQDSVQRNIERFHAAQFSDEVIGVMMPQVRKQMFSAYGITPFIEEQLPRLLDDLEEGKPGILCMTRTKVGGGGAFEGHAVVPWYVEDTALGWRIYVYDPNRNHASTTPSTDYSNREHYPYIDVYGTGWEFVWANNGPIWDGYLSYVPFDTALKNDYDLPTGKEFLVIVFASAEAESYAEDDDGEITGVVDGEIVVNIDNSTPIFLPTLSADTQLYGLPLGKPYDFHVTGKATGEYNWSVVGENSFYSIDSKLSAEGMEDVVSMVKDEDYARYSLRILSGAADDNFGVGIEHNFGNATREYGLENTTASDSGDMEVYVENGGDTLVIVNHGDDPISTEIVLRSTESDTHARESLSLAPKERVRVTDNWENLGEAPLQVSREKIDRGALEPYFYVIIGLLGAAIVIGASIALLVKRRKMAQQ